MKKILGISALSLLAVVALLFVMTRASAQQNPHFFP